MEYQDVVRDFAHRTKMNLHAIEKLRGQGAEVYEATQLINSMLGLLVFPREEFMDRIPETPLSDLERSGWPTPIARGGYSPPENLRQLVRYLRNAIAHFNIDFRTDSRREIVGLRVWNIDPSRRSKTWEADLSLHELRTIAERFSELAFVAADRHDGVPVVTKTPSTAENS